MRPAGSGCWTPGTARDLIAAAGRSPHTRWCVTVLHPDGTAAAHGCAAGRHPPPPGPEPPGPQPPDAEPPAPGPPGTAGPGTACGTSGGPDQRPPPDTRARDYLLSLGVRLALIARGGCDHRHAETGYQPSRKLQHLIRTRSTRCTAPGCGRPAARCDLDHTLAWDKGGLTCECGARPAVQAPPSVQAGTGVAAESAGTRCAAMAHPARTDLHHHPLPVPDVGGRTARRPGPIRDRLQIAGRRPASLITCQALTSSSWTRCRSGGTWTAIAELGRRGGERLTFTS